jgi:hypothetical protein
MNKLIPFPKRKYAHVDRPETSTVASRHVLIKGFHGVCASELTEFLVHVVCARARVVADPDTKVLHLQWLLFMNLGKEKRAAEHNGCQRQARCARYRSIVSTPARLPLEGCMGQHR